MKTIAHLILLVAAALCAAACAPVPAHWPPSPPVRSYEAHKPWGNNWHRDVR